MRSTLNLIVIAISLLVFSCVEKADKEEVKGVLKAKDAAGYEYEYVKDDPLKARIYTLKNGLKIYLTKNDETPRINTLIAVKAGSTYDPKETTGLAHYLEHMMFKGSSKIATVNWEEEKKLLDEISDLYEQHKSTDDKEEKKAIYAKIDSVSQLASNYAVPNEYDKLVALIGAKNTNAFTSNEQTVYMNDIPTNELDRWLQIESERFSQLVLRLFHTELETVYEEFNMTQDNDRRKVSAALMKALYEGHPYGEQTTIGKGEHLKNPSMVNIHKYFDTYYRPNNMAICMSGDLNYEETVKLIDKYWGAFKPNPNIKKPETPALKPITEPFVTEVFGPDAESVTVAFRLNGINSDDVKYASLVDMILSNSQAGLIDLDLVKKQKVLQAYSYSRFLKEHGMMVLSAKPREGQSLEEVKDLLLAELEKVKKGEFDDWMLEAVINDFKLSEIRQMESNYRVFQLLSTFVNEMPYDKVVNELDEYSKVTKDELLAFANKKFNNNYVVIYKRVGEDKNLMKVDKPQITPLDINRENQSEFFTNINAQKTEKINPVFVDYKKEISESSIAKNRIPFRYIENKINTLCNVSYIVDMGKYHNPKLALAVKYLPYIGTDKYSPEDLSKEFFKIGMSMDVYTGGERSYVFINGLDENLEEGIKLLEHVLANAKADKAIYDEFVKGILKERIDAKKDKRRILYGPMSSYALYGENSPYADNLTEEELKSINPQELVSLIKEMYAYQHHIFYYGPKSIDEANNLIAKYHQVPAELKEFPGKKEYKPLDNDKNKVYFVNYDMVQTQMLFYSKDVLLDNSIYPISRMFNEYFGGGMSSIVFQEIREAKGYAYSAYAGYGTPSKPEDYHTLYGFVATQPDKLYDATTAMTNLLNDMPRAEKQFDLSKEAIIKKLQTERITKQSIFWSYMNAKDKGLDYDIRKDLYAQVPGMTFDDMQAFVDEHVKGKNYTFMVLGNKDNIDFSKLEKIGEVKELSLEDVFHY